MTETERREALVTELRFVARRSLYSFDLDSVPRIADAVARLKGRRAPVSIKDVRQAIVAGVESLSSDDSALYQIALWLFGIPAESRRYTLSERQKRVGQSVGRSYGSVRQTDLAQVMAYLIDYLELSPHGILGPSTHYRSARGAR